ncbi:hypothetical protein [Sphingosinicella sp. YJ22]|uniref:hypothetical protein n=1 Tax=Sphingosinicella sp. YJ22 TaxID=1104780 RepID=UPI00140C8088|nr:hypothetical protein [Sphingosinicella sp. YJ22]
MNPVARFPRRAPKAASLGLVSMIALAHASPAAAQDECGPASDGGTVVCEATDPPYTSIRYTGATDYGVVLRSGVIVDGSLSTDFDPTVQVAGDGAISFFAEDGTFIFGGTGPALEVQSASGSVNVRADQVIGSGVAISAGAQGDVTVAANYVEGINGIDTSSAEGAITIDVGLAAGVGGRGVSAITFGSGDIAITAGQAYGVGESAMAINATAVGDGDVGIIAGEVYGIGDLTTAIWAQSMTGNVSIDAVRTIGEGFGAQGIIGLSDTGNVDINANTVFVSGDYGLGIGGVSRGDVNINAGYVFADGLEGRGIVAASEFGAITIDVDGVGAGGAGGRAILVESFGDVSIVVREYAGTFGDYAEAISVITNGDIAIDANRIYTYGIGANGILAIGGTATIEADVMETVGTAINASTIGDLDVAVGSVVSTSTDPEYYAMGLYSDQGDVSLTVRDGVTSQNSRAIVAYARLGDVNIDIEEGAVVSGAASAIQAGSSQTTRIDIAGTVTSGSGLVLDIRDNDFGVEGDSDIRIAATGTVLGRMSFVGGDDVVTNAGRFLTAGTSQFGGGADRLVNSGLLALRDGAATSITLAGLERLENSGTVSLANGRTGDSLTLSGTLAGAAGSTLAVDLDIVAGASDLVEVGDLEGTSALRLNIVGNGSGLGLDGLRVVSSAGTDSGAELTLAEASRRRGFVQFSLDYDGQDSWWLQSDLSDTAYLAGAMASGVRDLWHFGADALSTHLLVTRGGGEAGGVWMQAVGSDVDATTGLSHAGGSRDLQWSGSHEGVQFGAEKGFGPWQVGVTAGYGTARIDLGQDENSRFDVVNAGLYAGFASNGWFASAMLRADLIDVQSNWASVGLEGSGDGTSLGVDLEAGYRADVGGIWIEPAAGLSWVHVSLPDQESVNGDIAWEDGAVATGEVGLRMGVADGVLGLPVRPFLAMSLAREFGGRDRTVFDLGSEEVVVTADGGRTYGQLGGGLAVTAGRVDLYAEADGRFGDIEGVSGRVGARLRF